MTMSSFTSFLFTLFTLNLFIGSQVYAVPYDHTYTFGCLPKAEAPQYKGGIVVNPEFNEELKGWGAIGNAKIATGQEADGNKYAVVSNIQTNKSDGIAQTFNLDKDKFYIVSAWLQTGSAEASVHIKLVSSSGNVTGGWIIAKSGCWTFLKGGFKGNVTGPADIRFETINVGVEIWVDNVSLQPFTQEEWKAHQDESIEKVRKTSVKFEAVDENGKPLANAAISIKQLEPHFPWGNAFNGDFNFVHLPAFEKWFNARFRYTVFENELKWASTEPEQGALNYTLADKMLEFAKKHKLKVRGHNILWDDPKYMPKWQENMQGEELRPITLKRAESIITKYKDQFIHWDVINENMHYDTYSRLTSNGTEIFKLLREIDLAPLPFLNEFNVIEDSSIIGKAQPWRHFMKIEQLRNGGYDGPLGIGLQSHFNQYAPNYPFIRASIDMLASTGLTMWVTEFDVNSRVADQLAYIEPLLHELFSHPAISGIILWASLHENVACYMMCMTDNDYKNLPAGDLVDKFIFEYIRVPDLNAKTDGNGVFQASLFYGEYEATLTPPAGAPLTQKFNLMPKGDVTSVQFKLSSAPNPEL